MTSVNLWRTVAFVATLGWAGTGLAWVMSASAPPPTETRQARAPHADRPETRRAERRSRRPVRKPMKDAPSTTTATPDLAELRDEVRSEVLEEFEQERAERRQQRSERHLGRLLDQVTAFAEEHGLDADAQSALESSMVTMHERLEELRPPGPPGPGGPPPEVMESLEEAFGQFQDEVGEALDDAELADLFTERMTPRPLRDRN